MQPVFVVSTGRCGSTLLSQILQLHAETLNLNEFFASIILNAAESTGQRLDGQEFWRLLSAPEPFFDSIVRNGLDLPELCYPYGTGRFTAVEGIPRISHMTLPMLAEDPDALYDELAGEVPGWPVRSWPDHVKALFAYLANRSGRHIVVERSGGSLMFMKLLSDHFNEARFVHLYRDGPDCALSMSRHLGSRPVGLAEWAGLLSGEPREPDGRAGEVTELLRPPLDAAEVVAYPAPPVSAFGSLWSRLTVFGLTFLRRLDPASWISLRYEDLVVDPDKELTRLAEFIGAEPAPAWLDAASALVDGGRQGQSARLPGDEYAALRESCEPGMRAIAERVTR